jgi:hypothetical protein
MLRQRGEVIVHHYLQKENTRNNQYTQQKHECAGKIYASTD